MSTNKKEINAAAVNCLRKQSKTSYILYKLYILKLYDITFFNDLYIYGATALFKFNWFNPITYIFTTVSIILVILQSLRQSLILAFENIKHGLTVYVE